MPAWALKDCSNIIAEPLTVLINAFLAAEKFPSHLKHAHIIPIYKNGGTEDPSNYRPTSIISALSKIFEKIIKDQIDDYIEKNHLHSPLQSGFRRGFSTTDAILYATEKIRLSLDNKKMVASALLELSKAFDSTSHNLLIAKLKSVIFNTSAIKMIEFYLKNRSQKVVLQNVSSDWIHLYQGVPQGTILGPLLFNLNVNIMLKPSLNHVNLSNMLLILSFS